MREDEGVHNSDKDCSLRERRNIALPLARHRARGMGRECILVTLDVDLPPRHEPFIVARSITTRVTQWQRTRESIQRLLNGLMILTAVIQSFVR